MAMKCIQISKDQVAIVDDDDFESLAQYRWGASGKPGRFYARRSTYAGVVNGKYHYEKVYMHRVIMRALKGIGVDHRNGNTLDNRKENLRLATQTENNANAKRRSDNPTGFKGVHIIKNQKNPFQANITKNGKFTYLGVFPTAEKAHAAYCKAATEIHGEFARFN